MLAHFHSTIQVYCSARDKIMFSTFIWHCVQNWFPLTTPFAESPFDRIGCYLLRLRYDVLRHIRRHYPSFIAPTGSCARPNPSRRLWFDLIRQVFAGCRQSLLEDGPSRHYLCNPCVSAWPPTPQCPSRCSCLLLPWRQWPHIEIGPYRRTAAMEEGWTRWTSPIRLVHIFF